MAFLQRERTQPQRASSLEMVDWNKFSLPRTFRRRLPDIEERLPLFWPMQIFRHGGVRGPRQRWSEVGRPAELFALSEIGRQWAAPFECGGALCVRRGVLGEARCPSVSPRGNQDGAVCLLGGILDSGIPFSDSTDVHGCVSGMFRKVCTMRFPDSAQCSEKLFRAVCEDHQPSIRIRDTKYARMCQECLHGCGMFMAPRSLRTCKAVTSDGALSPSARDGGSIVRKLHVYWGHAPPNQLKCILVDGRSVPTKCSWTAWGMW